MKLLEIPSYECPYCGILITPTPQGVSPTMTHCILEHPFGYMNLGWEPGPRPECPWSDKKLRVKVHMVDAELLP